MAIVAFMPAVPGATVRPARPRFESRTALALAPRAAVVRVGSGRQRRRQQLAAPPLLAKGVGPAAAVLVQEELQRHGGHDGRVGGLALRA
jgi:hypothetical protein